MKKHRELLLILLAFGVLTWLGHHTYLLEWLAKRYFCLIWLPIVLLWFFRQKILSRYLSIGAIGGLFLGQLAENIKWEIYGSDSMVAHSSYWGVGIWFATVAMAFLMGILYSKYKRKNTTE